MRSVRAVGLYLLFVFMGGALLAPWLYQLMQVAAGLFPALESAASKSFPRYVSRALLGLALVGLPVFLRAADLSSWRTLGLGRNSAAVTQLAWGFAFGLVSLACIAGLALAAGAREVTHEHRVGAVLLHLGKAGLIAAVVAPLEEIFFRGALFGSLRKLFHWTAALALSSGVYAMLHFLERSGGIAIVRWNSGFVVLAGMVSGFADLGKVIPGFLNLTLVGMILGLAYQRLGSLYFSIGLHAGWIFWLKTYGYITDETAVSRTWLFGTNKLINGWLAFLVLAALLGLLCRHLAQESSHASWKDRRLLS
ncbi:MAG: CPBP family intramembrane glutamic endopeptidase [Verrucomicrobiota bacterium]